MLGLSPLADPLARALFVHHRELLPRSVEQRLLPAPLRLSEISPLGVFRAVVEFCQPQSQRPVIRMSGPTPLPLAKSERAKRIKQMICKRYKITAAELLGGQRRSIFVRPRHIAIYLCSRACEYSLPELGRRFGNRDHTTILHAIRKLETDRKRDPELAALLDDSLKEIESWNAGFQS